MIPSEISQKDLEIAIDYLNKNHWDKKNESTKFDLLFNGKKYPPKEVIRKAWMLMGKKDELYFSGGIEANNFLIKRNFIIVEKNLNNELIDDIDKIKSSNDEESEKLQLINCRIGQGDYRERLLHLWKKCPITNINNPALLIASHIKPWRSCTSKAEKIDVNNGIILSPLFDKLFDRGYISFDSNGKVLLNNKIIDDNTYVEIEKYKSVKLKLNEKQLEYLEYHRKKIYLG